MDPCYSETKECSSQLFGARKKRMTAILSQFAAIWRDKNLDPCSLETKKCSLQLVGARKKKMTAISSQKNWFTAIWRAKKVETCYLEPQNVVHNSLEQRKRG